MKVDMLMPQMGESIAEATISKWLKKPGETVKKDEVILEISTDKVDSEIPAPATGTLAEILFKEGDVVPVKTKIATIDPSASTAAAGSPADRGSASVVTTVTASEKPTGTSGSTAHENGSAELPDQESGRFFSPLVMSLAQKHRVSNSELEAIRGTGVGGRVTKQDLLAHVEASKGSDRGGSPAIVAANAGPSSPTVQVGSSPAVRASSSGAESGRGSGTREAPTPTMNDWGSDGTKIVPMDSMRQAIADHMVRSKHTSPHVYSIQEVDVTNISKWRSRHKETFEKQEGFKLSFTPFFLEAAVRGLQQFPIVNSSVDGKKVIYKKHVNLGCAVALGNSGLIVPVIKKAEERNLIGLARGLNDLALRARNKKLLPDDVQGGTFTVTNPGVFGTIIGTPIINQPQVAILCLGAIQKRPVVIDDMIGIREMCYLTLSYDHRIIDGAMGGQYLQFVCQYLENWDMERGLN